MSKQKNVPPSCWFSRATLLAQRTRAIALLSLVLLIGLGSLPTPQPVQSYLITATISQTNNLPTAALCGEGVLTRHDFLTATLSSPVLWDGGPCEGTVALIGDEATILYGPDDDNSARFIIMLKTPPLAVRLNEIQRDQALTPAQREASINAYAARLTTEHTAVLDTLQKKGMVQQVGWQFIYLVNGIAVTARLDDRKAIAKLPQVQDVYFDHQAHMTLADSVPLIGAPAVWAMVDGSGNPVTGQGTTVAIIDSGIDYTHPDLGGCFGAGCKVVGGYDFVNNDDDPMDTHGHGTHVAGIVAGNGTITGVAPEAALMAYKVCNTNEDCSTSGIIAALERAVMDQVDAVNISLGALGSPDDPLAQATDQAVDQGVAVVVAAGNNKDYRRIDSPGVAAKALTVGATNKSDGLYGLTSRGPVSSYLIKPDLVAPGENIYSSKPNHSYAPMSGTSMASPHIAGAVALLKQLHPDWTPGMLKASLMNTALPLGYDPFAEGAGRVQVGQAATTTVLIQPGSLSLGRVDDSQPTWTTAMPFEISNLANVAQSYQLSVDAGLPTGASAQLSSTSFTLNPGQTEVVSLSVTVDTNLLSYPIAQPYAYHGHIIIASGTEDRHVPFAFMPSPLDCETQDQIPAAECTALEALYNSTNGVNWYRNEGWLDIPPCDWYGMTCSTEHVTRLSLYRGLFRGNNLVGSIPPELRDLASLEELWLVFNPYLNGHIPPELGNLSNLRKLLLSYNDLSDSIPPELGNLNNLQVLQLQSNDLSGSIPPELGNLTNLQNLSLSTNHLSGSIPPKLGNLTNLLGFFLYNNQLSGNIPPELGNLTDLSSLYIHNNALAGEVPAAITNLTDLSGTDVGYNGLTASSPAVAIFLGDKDSDWAQTQTAPPTNVRATAQSSNSVQLTWTPILYTGDGGYYEISCATISGGPYTVHGTTSDKTATNYLADNLSPNTTYYFVVRTYTPAHGNQQNDLLSGTSQEVSAATTVLIVDSTGDGGDNNPGDGVCDDGTGNCTLRAAIEETNTISGTETIKFDIPGPGPHAIQPTSSLPPITDPVVIDGTTEPDFVGTPIVELDGSMAGSCDGLRITAGNSTIRGLVISRFNHGIRLETHGSNMIEGNFIGTDVTGTPDLGNAGHGVLIYDSPNNTIGGTAPGTGNVIGGNFFSGVAISHDGAMGNRVQGNFIGTDVTGTAALGNDDWGVIIAAGASNNTIGGIAREAGNTIAFNHFDGVTVVNSSTINNAILSNSIFSNGGLGIDLVPSYGVTPNDLGDDDTGANNLQNFPVLTRVISWGGDTTIEGTLNSTANTTFSLQFFVNSTCDPDDHGEGETLLGSASVTTNASGDANFTVAFLSTTVPPGHFVTATATDPDNNTSEFSRCFGFPGKIVVNNDEWTLSDEGFAETPADAAQFALNVAKWFKGGTSASGNFLVYSTPFGLNTGLTGDELSSAMISAGHSWTVISTTTSFSLYDLLPYDGIFLAGSQADNFNNPPPVVPPDTQVLIDYVKAGGNVYLAGGTDPDLPQAEADQWNSFLNACGLKFEAPLNNVVGTLRFNSGHPIFAGVQRLFQRDGNSIREVVPSDPNGNAAILVQSRQGEGLYAVCSFGGPIDEVPIVTAIDLLSFTAQAGTDHVTLAWETGTEVDNAGFNLWRSEAADGPYTKHNDALIPAEGDPVSGASYVYTDTEVVKGVTYYYQLEDVDIYGVSTFHGPVSATPSSTHRIYLPLIFK